MQKPFAHYGLFGVSGAALILALAVFAFISSRTPERNSAAIAAVAPQFLPVAQSGADGARLLLGFVDSSGSYLANVRVDIADHRGATIARIVSDGPWLDLAVNPGTYHVLAVFEGKARELRDLRVEQRDILTRVISWDLNVPATEMMARVGVRSNA